MPADPLQPERGTRATGPRFPAFQQLADFFRDPLLIVDIGGVVQADNIAARDLFGLPKPTMLAGTPLLDRCSDRDRVAAYLAASARSSAPSPGLLKLRIADGEPAKSLRCYCGRILATGASGAEAESPLLLLRCLAKAHANRDFKELDSQIDSLRREIEARKSAEEALRRSEHKFQALFEAAPDATLICCSNGTILLTNDAFDALFGYPQGALIGTHVDRLLPSIRSPAGTPSDECFGDISRPQLHGGSRAIAMCSSGSELPVDVRLSPLTIDAGPVVVVAVRDLSEQVRADSARRDFERKMQQGQKLESLGVLAGGIAHDFNNLLLGVMGNADLILMADPESPSIRTHVQDIVTSAERAADLCKQLLAYSGRGQFVIAPADLSEMVSEMVHLLEVSIHKKCVLKCDFADELPPAEVDHTQLRQVIMNLIINASDATGEGPGTVTVRTGSMVCDEAYLSRTHVHADLKPGPYVFVEVTDTGCGIDSGVLSRIFDPFYTTKSTGRGLGLAAVLGIVRSHRGALKVYSEVGKGTTFKVLLPEAAKGTNVIARRKDDKPKWNGRGTVLVVDDERAVRTLAATVLRRHGFDVVTAENGQVALDRFEAQRADIVAVLLDMTMPVLGGEETFRALRAMDPQLPVVFSSGYNERDGDDQLAGGPLVSFVQKPYRVAELVHALRALLDPGVREGAS